MIPAIQRGSSSSKSRHFRVADHIHRGCWGRDGGLTIAVENNAIRSIGWASRRASAMEFRRGNTFPAFFRFSSSGASHRNEAAWPLRPEAKYSCAIPRGGRLAPFALRRAQNHGTLRIMPRARPSPPRRQYSDRFMRSIRILFGER